MLGKLIKHEYLYLLKTFTPIYVIYIGLAVLLSILTRVDDAELFSGTVGTTIEIFTAIMAVVYVFGTMVLAVLTMFDSIRRFHKNMLTDEGYLTNTLPVTATEHIAAKLIGGITNYVISFVIIAVSVCIMAGNHIKDMIKGISLVINDIELKPEHIALILIVGLSVYLALILLGYFIACINSMANSKGAVGVLLAIVLFNAASYILAEVNMLVSKYCDFDETGTALVNALFFLVCAGIMFFFTRLILKKHLNLQ